MDDKIKNQCEELAKVLFILDSQVADNVGESKHLSRAAQIVRGVHDRTRIANIKQGLDNGK